MRIKCKVYLGQIIFFSFFVFVGISCDKEEIVTVPVIEIYNLHNKTDSTASFSTSINSNIDSSFYDYGVCWSTEKTPTIEDKKTNKSTYILNKKGFKISNLSPYTKYYARAYATNSAGTFYSDTISITTYGIVYDIEGNDYLTNKFDTQEWMIENMQTTRYNNNDPIPNVSNYDDWTNLTSGAYFEEMEYSDIDNILINYRIVYNWYLVNDGRNVCPTGWHVPTNDEWTTLGNFIEGNTILVKDFLDPSGLIHDNGWTIGSNLGKSVWWTPSESNDIEAWVFDAGFFLEFELRSTLKRYGNSIRCIKD
ncbi:MAG: FISUMP domain-containing protein [Bacteroidota bacterium]